MRKRLGCIALTFPIWLVVVALGLECWERFHWEWTLRTNTLIRQMQGQQPWRFASQWEGNPDEHSVLPSPPAPACPSLEGIVPLPAVEAAQPSTSPYSPAIWGDDLQARMALFDGLDANEKQLFDVLGRELCLADNAGQVLKYCRIQTFQAWQPNDRYEGRSVTDIWGPEALELVKQAAQSNALQQRTFMNTARPDQGSMDALAFPAKNEAGEVVGIYCVADQSAPTDPMNVFSDPFYRYKRNYVGNDGSFRANNLGFRGQDVAIPKARGTYRVLCLGGSTTFEGMTEASHYPKLLQDMLQTCFGAVRQVEVLNGGIPGMYSYGHRSRFLEYLAVDPDVIVYYMGINDIWQQHILTWCQLVTPWQVKARRSMFIRHWFNWALMPPEDVIRRTLAETSFVEIDTMLQYARKHGVKVVFCSFAYPRELSRRERGYYEWQNKSFHKSYSGDKVTFSTFCRLMDIYNEMLKAYCEKEGVPYIPVQENIKGGFNFFGDLCHMRNEAIPVKARIIFDSVKELVSADLRAAEGAG